MNEWCAGLAAEIDAPTIKVLPLILTDREVQAWLSSAPERLGLRVLAESGLRAAESWHPGRGAWIETASRRVPISESLRRELEGYVPRDLTLAGADASRFSSCGRRLSLSTLRHTYAVRRLEAGVDLLLLHVLLGNRDFRTTEAYARAAIADCLPWYRQCHPIFATRARPKHYPLTPEQALTLIRSGADPLKRLMLRVLWCAGLRASEVVSLERGDLDGDGRLFVRDGKGDFDRYTWIDEESADEMRALPGQARFFPGGRQHVWDVLKAAAETSGLLSASKGFTLSPHTLRHAYATQCYAHGMPPEILQRLLGHGFLENTLVYVDVPGERVAAEYLRAANESLTQPAQARFTFGP